MAAPWGKVDYDSLTDDEKASLRKTPLYDRAKDLGLVPVTRTNTLVIPGRVQITRHTDEHGVKTTETVDLRDPDDLHNRFAEALGQEWRKLEASKDVRHEWLAAFERAVEIAGEVWGKERTLDVYANGRLLTLDITGEGALRVETIGLNNVSVGWMRR